MYIIGWCGGGSNSTRPFQDSTSQNSDEDNDECENFEGWRHTEGNTSENITTITSRNCDEAFDHFAGYHKTSAFCHNFVDDRTNTFAEVACCM